jgi:hypothetical protein
LRIYARMPRAKPPYVTDDGLYDLVLAFGKENVKLLSKHVTLYSKVRHNDANNADDEAEPFYLYKRRQFCRLQTQLKKLLAEKEEKDLQREQKRKRKRQAAALALRKTYENATDIIGDTSSSISSSSSSSSSDSDSSTSKPTSSSSSSSTDTAAPPPAKKKKPEYDDVGIDSYLSVDHHSALIINNAQDEFNAGELPEAAAAEAASSLLLHHGEVEEMPQQQSSAVHHNLLTSTSSSNNEESDNPAAAAASSVEPQQQDPDVPISLLVDAVRQKVQQLESPSSSDCSLSGPDRVRRHRRRPPVVVVNIGEQNNVEEDEEDDDVLGGIEQQEDDEFPVPIGETSAANADADLLQAYFEDDSPAAAVEPAAASSRKHKPSILQIEVAERLKAIRKKDRKGAITWPNLIRHVASLLNFPQCDTTVMLQILKGAEKDLVASKTKLSELAETGGGLMEPPKAELKAARLKYM